MGENLAGIDQRAKVRIPSPTGTAAYRIPDALTETELKEVKNVPRLTRTGQMQDFHQYASTTGRTFVLVTRNNTILSGPLQDMIHSGDIALGPVLRPPKS